MKKIQVEAQFTHTQTQKVYKSRLLPYALYCSYSIITKNIKHLKPLLSIETQIMKSRIGYTKISFQTNIDGDPIERQKIAIENYIKKNKPLSSSQILKKYLSFKHQCIILGALMVGPEGLEPPTTPL